MRHPTDGHVSKAGAPPRSTDRWYPMDLPFIETLEQAKHFKLGPEAAQRLARASLSLCWLLPSLMLGRRWLALLHRTVRSKQVHVRK